MNQLQKVKKYSTTFYVGKVDKAWTLYSLFFISGIVTTCFGLTNINNQRIPLLTAAFLFYFISLIYFIDFKYLRIMLELRDQEKWRNTNVRKEKNKS